MADVELFFDPSCPFCWQTSKWLRQVQRLAGIDIRYRFISLALLNRDGSPSPAIAAAQHQGTRLLRVAAAVRATADNDAVGRFYAATGEAVFEVEPPSPGGFAGILAHQAAGIDIPTALERAGLPGVLAAAADDPAHDDLLADETAEALARAGEDVGTPIVSFAPPDGPAFFGPVISDLPDDQEAVELFDAVARLARWRGFAELKRTMRDFPDVRIGRDLRMASAAGG